MLEHLNSPGPKVNPDGMAFRELMAQHKLSVKQVADAADVPVYIVKHILKGGQLPVDVYEYVMKVLRDEWQSYRPDELEAPRIAPDRKVFLMDDPERMALAADPKHWAWWCHTYLTGTDGHPLRLMWFHVEALRRMFAGGKLVINLPTDHMKSVISSFVFPMLSLAADPNESHIICGANLNDSKRRVQAIQRELETNKILLRDYPWLGKPEGRGQARHWSTTELTVTGRTINKPNPSVLASAVGSGDIRGRRGKLLLDDTEGDKQRWSQLARQQLYDFIKLEAIRCYESPNETSRPLLCALGTPFTVDSVYFKLEREGWDVIRYPVYNEDGTLLWPEKAKKVNDARRSLNKAQFAIAYLMDPTGGDTSMLSEQQIRELMQEPKFDPEGWQTYISIDPAAGTGNRRADYCGICVCRIRWKQGNKLPEVEVLRAIKCTEGLWEQVHLCAALAAEYGAPVVYETNGQQGGTYATTFAHLHPEVSLIRHYTSAGNKFDTEMGLTVLRTLLRERCLLSTPDQLETEGLQTLITEIRDLGQGAHDHIACSLWFVVRHAYQGARMFSGPRVASTYGQARIGGLRFGGATTAFRFGGAVHNRSPLLDAQRAEQERFRRQHEGAA